MPTLLPLDNLLGAAQVGVLISTVIYEITCLQAYLYYIEHSARDGKLLKAYDVRLIPCRTTETAVYHYTVTNFGDYAVLARGTWSLLVQVPIGGFVGAMVQLFFAYRIYRFSHERLLIPVTICLLSVAQFAMAIGTVLMSSDVAVLLTDIRVVAYDVTAFQAVFFANTGAMASYTTASLSMDIACDTLISAATIYYLKRQRTSIKLTTKAINRIITYSLNTCLLTTTFTIACLVAWQLAMNTLINAPFYFICVWLYSCSLLSILNSRDSIREELGRKADGIISLGELSSTIAMPLGGRPSSSTDVERGSAKAKKPFLNVE